MKRSIQQSGGALTISLPAEYAKRQDLAKGDVLTYLIWADRLVFYPSEGPEERLSEEASFDLTGLATRSIWTTLNHMYTYGSKKITLTFKNVKLHVHHIKPLSNYGTNALSNLTTLCEKCHMRIHPHMRINKVITAMFGIGALIGLIGLFTARLEILTLAFLLVFLATTIKYTQIKYFILRKKFRKIFKIR